MDIRKFFGQPSKNRNPASTAAVGLGKQSLDEKPNPTRKRRVVLSSSDDSDAEDPVPSKVKKNLAKSKPGVHLDKFRHAPEQDVSRVAKSSPTKEKLKPLRAGNAKLPSVPVAREKVVKPVEKNHGSPQKPVIDSKPVEIAVIDLDDDETDARPRSGGDSLRKTPTAKTKPSSKLSSPDSNPKENVEKLVAGNSPGKEKLSRDSKSSKPATNHVKMGNHDVINVVTVSTYFNKDKANGSKTVKKQAERNDDSDDEFSALLDELDEQGSIPSCSSANNSPAVNSCSRSTEQKIVSEPEIVSEPSNKSPKKPSPNKAPEFTEIHPGESPTTPKVQLSKPSSSKRKTEASVITTKESVKTPSSAKQASNYYNFKNREGPSSIGSRDIPEVVPNALHGLTFVLTGTLDTIEHDHYHQLVKESGGRITSAVSKKTSYLVVGKAPGQSKSQKAGELGVKLLDEDQFFSLLEDKFKHAAGVEKRSPASVSSANKDLPSTISKAKSPPPTTAKPSETIASGSQPQALSSQSGDDSQSTTATTSSGRLKRIEVASSYQLVDKYKPVGLKQIIGQQGDRSNMNKFINWLRNWAKWHLSAGEKKQGRWNSDDGSDKRAVLFSGPPGVGKTTTASIVCKEFGLSFSEFNASDKRNKKSLEETVSELTNSKSMDSFRSADTKLTSRCPGIAHVLIMDEIDGMSGNEDRGGMQEVIGLIKKSKIPIICICNDRNSQKIRSLANYCFDLRFHRPTVQQIKGAMMSIAFKEGIKLNSTVMDQVIAGANQDVRQVLHRLGMLKAQDDPNVSEEQAGGLMSKNVVMNPFEMARLMVSANEETGKMNLNEKAEKFFFTDYSLMPLFFHENYLNASPKAANKSPVGRLKLFAQAADLLTYGDLCDRQIRNSGVWSLLPQQGFFSVVLPGEKIKGYLQGMVSFPSWLGKNSTRNKNYRLIQEMQNHMSLKTSSNNDSLNMEYLPAIRNAMKVPLLSDEVAPAIEMCNAYDLSREDKDALFEVTEYGSKAGAGGFWSQLPSKTKAAFTRSFNKTGHALPYTTGAEVGGKKRKRTAITGLEDVVLDEEGNVIKGAGAGEEEDGEDSGADEDSTAAPVAKKPKTTTGGKTNSQKNKPEKPSGSKKSKK